MAKKKNALITVQGTDITVLSHQQGDFISLTDMTKHFDGGGALIEQWLKNKDTVLFLGVWEKINNPSFNSLEFEGIKNEAGRNGRDECRVYPHEVTAGRSLKASQRDSDSATSVSPGTWRDQAAGSRRRNKIMSKQIENGKLRTENST